MVRKEQKANDTEHDTTDVIIYDAINNSVGTI